MTSSTAGLVIVGSGPAGVAAALAYRDAGGAGRVQIVTADADMPYERPPLSKDFLSGESGNGSTVLNPTATYGDRGIEMLLGEPAVQLDLAARAVGTGSGRRLAFERCVLAMGAGPIRPSTPGTDLPGVHVLRSFEDAQALRKAASGARRVVVVGAGFVGCEAASSLARLGLPVTLLCSDALPQQARLGAHAAAVIGGWVRAEGVELIGGRRLAAITSAGRGWLLVHTNTGAAFRADLVLLATGISARIQLGQRAGLAVAAGRLRVDDQLRTDVPGVFAAGDVARAYNTRARRHLSVEHWGDALAMGEIAGANAAGRSSRWQAVPGFWSTIGDHTIKYAAWGDGYDHARVIDHANGAFTIWYGRDRRTVGVLTHNADHDYTAGMARVEQGQPLSKAGSLRR